MNNPERPSEFDAVLGGQTPPPIDGVVLGGIEGVKHRLKSSDIEIQINALSEALDYGKPGLDLVIDILVRSPANVQRLIARLLQDKGGIEGRQFLLDYNPQLFFTALEDGDKKDELHSQYVLKATEALRTIDLSICEFLDEM